MSLVAGTEDRFSFQAPESPDRGQRLAVSYSGSIAINAVFIALMMMGIDIYAAPLGLIEMPIEVTIEAPPKADPPAVQKVRPLPFFLPPAAAFNAQSKYAFDMREIANAERQRTGAPNKTVDGNGTGKLPTASPRTNTEKRDSEELKNDTDKEADRVVPPPVKDSQSQQRAKIAPPGEDSRLLATDEPKAEAADETTAKGEEIQCGAKRKRLPRPSGTPPWRGQVVWELTKGQVDQLVQRAQASRDLLVSPDYLDNVVVVVRDEGGVSWSVSVPHGLTVRSGDRIEFVPIRMDPSRPCHFIPSLVSRVL